MCSIHGHSLALPRSQRRKGKTQESAGEGAAQPLCRQVPSFLMAFSESFTPYGRQDRCLHLPPTEKAGASTLRAPHVARPVPRADDLTQQGHPRALAVAEHQRSGVRPSQKSLLKVIWLGRNLTSELERVASVESPVLREVPRTKSAKSLLFEMEDRPPGEDFRRFRGRRRLEIIEHQ